MTESPDTAHRQKREIAADMFRQAGVTIDWQSARCGYQGKWTAPSADSTCFVKLAPSPGAAAMLRREAEAYAGGLPPGTYRLPTLHRFDDHGDWAIAIWERLPNRALQRVSALVRRVGPFEQAPVRFDYPADLLPECTREGPLTPWRKRLLQRIGGGLIESGPAHGDFVYWNTGVLPGGAKVLFDLEYYRAQRYRYFDRLYWTLLPLVRQAAKHPWLANALIAGAPFLAAGLLPGAHSLSASDALAIMVLDHASEVNCENHRPDILELVAPEEMTQRKAIVTIYTRILERILG